MELPALSDVPYCAAYDGPSLGIEQKPKEPKTHR
jgi:hypothetical protein